MASLIYTTGRVVKIPSKLLYVTHLTIVIFISLYIIGYEKAIAIFNKSRLIKKTNVNEINV